MTSWGIFLTHTVGLQPTLYTLYLKKRTNFETV